MDIAKVIFSVVFFFFLTALVFFSLSAVMAADAVLTWEAPTTNDDGSPLTDLNGFEVYQRDYGGVYDFSASIANLSATELTYTVQGLQEGHFVWVVLAVDTSGNKSYSSNEAGKVIRIIPGEVLNLKSQ